jgi:hypothetical protein
MQFAQRYPAIMARFDRFWKGEETDRPLLHLSAPKDEPDTSVPPPPHPDDASLRVLPEYMVAAARHRLATTAYFAEGFPHVFVNFGPGVLHGCIGGDLDLSHWDTTWFPPFLSDITEFTSLQFQPNGKWWPRVMRATEALLDEVGDEMVISNTDIGGCGDVVASAVGRQILVDIADRPEAVKAAVDHCHGLWLEAYEDNYRLLHQKQDITSPWWPIISRGRTYMTQCDINALISPQAFSCIFLDDLAGLFQHLDHGAYHLDGIGTEGHVPALVAQPGLHCIQWVPAPGTSALRHAEMLRGIQDAGVNVTFNAAPSDVEEMCRVFDRRRLYLNIGCESEAQAKCLLENVPRWCE